MSDEEIPCGSTTSVDGQPVHCRREEGHASVHLGAVPSDVPGIAEELRQWTDADAIDDSGPVDELPVWYAVLPIDEIVKVVAIRAVDPHYGRLVGAVLDDHEQISAIVLHDEDRRRRVILPWQNVASLGWDSES